MKARDNKKRLSITKKIEANERGERALRKDGVLRRSLSASSLGRKRSGSKPTASAPSQKKDAYKHDGEAYKRRENPVALVNKLIQKGSPISGVKIT